MTITERDNRREPTEKEVLSRIHLRLDAKIFLPLVRGQNIHTLRCISQDDDDINIIPAEGIRSSTKTLTYFS